MICPKCGTSITKIQCDCGFDMLSCNTSFIGNEFKSEVVALIESIQESEEYLIIEEILDHLRTEITAASSLLTNYKDIKRGNSVKRKRIESAIDRLKKVEASAISQIKEYIGDEAIKRDKDKSISEDLYGLVSKGEGTVRELQRLLQQIDIEWEIDNVEQKLDNMMEEYADFVKKYEKGVEKLKKTKASVQELNSFMEDNLKKERQYKKEINNCLRKLKELEDKQEL